MTENDRYFERDFRVSHAVFCQNAGDLGMQMEISPAFGVGSDGKPVHSAVALNQRPSECDACVVISTGLHGVEALFGNAVLSQCFEDWRNAGLPECKLVLLHTINPFGFSHSRRVDDCNRDLNRNFRSWSADRAGAENVESNELYAELDPLLNPKQSRPSSRWFFYLRALRAIQKYGFLRVRDAVAGGQYQFPEGLFYGGSEPAPQIAWLKHRFPDWLRGVNRCIHLDLHTGLGRRGEAQLFLESTLDATNRPTMERYLGEEASLVELRTRQTREGGEKVYAASGSLGSWMVQQQWVPDFHFAVAEFGTYPSLRVLHALVQENALRNSTAVAATQADAPKRTEHLDQVQRELIEVFCPASHAWRQQVLEKSRSIVAGAIQFAAA